MQVSYRKLFTDNNDIEYSVVKTQGTRCLCLQGNTKNQARVKKAFLSSKCFFEQASENIFKPLSINTSAKDGLVTALFENIDGGELSKFLLVVPPAWQYAAGKKLGLLLRQLHSVPLNTKQKEKASKRHEKFMEHLASYIADLPHFKNDKYAMEAISSRYDHFKIYRPVMRYGGLKHQKIMITKESSLLLLPSYTYGPGDMCEDFASLECESAGLYPLFCAGVIDGYFASKVPSKFWLHFALYSALYSLWKCALVAKQSPQMMVKMQLNSDRIREDFDDFKKPVPQWYSDPKLQDIRTQALKLSI